MIEAAVGQRPVRDSLDWLDELSYQEPAHAAEVESPPRPVRVGKIAEIQVWEQKKETERDTKFVELGRCLCEV